VDEGQATLTAIGLGFAVALIVIVAAFFQDPIVAAARWTARWVVRVLRPVADVLSGAVGAGGRRAAGAALRAPEGVVRALATLAGPPREPATPRRPAPIAPTPKRSRGRRASGDASRATRPVAAEGGGLATEPDEERSASEDRAAAAPRPGLGQGRLYAPTSSLHMEEEARAYMQPRDGRVPVESLVRHLDQQFGTGRGAGVLEVLRRRGLVRVSRDPDAPTRMVAALVDEPTGSSDDG